MANQMQHKVDNARELGLHRAFLEYVRIHYEPDALRTLVFGIWVS